jgi:hypothetical protein
MQVRDFHSKFILADPPLPNSCWVYYPFLLVGTDQNIQKLPFRKGPSAFRTLEIEETFQIDLLFAINEAIVSKPSVRFLESKTSSPVVQKHSIRHDDDIADFAQVISSAMRSKKISYVLTSPTAAELKKLQVILTCALWSYFRYSEKEYFRPPTEVLEWVSSAMTNFCSSVGGGADPTPTEYRILARYRRPMKILMIGAESSKYLFSSEIEMELLDLPKFSSIFTSTRRGVDTLLFEKMSAPGKHSVRQHKIFQLAPPSKNAAATRVLGGKPQTDFSSRPADTYEKWVEMAIGMSWDQIFIFDPDLECSAVNAMIASEFWTRGQGTPRIWVHTQKRKIEFDGDFEKV